MDVFGKASSSVMQFLCTQDIIELRVYSLSICSIYKMCVFPVLGMVPISSGEVVYH